MSAGRTIAKATLVIAVINLISRLLGFIRETVIARQFGATGATDAYLVAYTIPSVLMSILALALATVVVPVFSEYQAKGQRQQAWQLFNIVTNLTALVFIAITVVGMLWAPYLVKIIAPGLKGEAALLAPELTRLMMPILLFMGLSTLFNGLLNANNIFAIPAFSTVASNVVVIISALTLGSFMGIQGLTIGTVLGMVVATLFQIPALYRSGFRYKLDLNWQHPGVKQVMALMLPVALGVSVNQVYIIVDRILASGLPAGSIAALNFANKLILLPIGLFVMAIGTAFYPTLTRQAVDSSSGNMADTLRRAFRAVVLLSVPAGVGLAVLRYPIIKLLFERGEFDAQATAMTAFALLFFSIGLVGQAANVILTRGFYALHDTKTPVKLTVITILINLAFSLMLIGPLKHGGLALANSIAALANTFMLSWYLARRIKDLWDKQTFIFIVQVVLASALMAVCTHFADGYIQQLFAHMGTMGLALRVAASITVGVAVYGLAAVLLRLEEVFMVLNYGKRFLALRKN